MRNHLDRLDLNADTSLLDPPMQTDIPRLRRGRIGGVFLAAFVPPSLEPAAATRALFGQIDVIHRLADRYPDAFAMASSADEIERIHKSGRIALLVGVEGGHAIGNSLAVLRAAHLCGARYLTLTHMKNNDWADAALWPEVGNDTAPHAGLTAFGREVVREANRLGVLVDLSHTADATMRAALEVSEAPVIFSHSGARALCDHARNVPDEILRRITTNRGIVMVDFVPPFITEAAPCLFRSGHRRAAPS